MTSSSSFSPSSPNPNRLRLQHRMQRQQQRQQQQGQQSDVWYETWQLLNLAIPTMVIQLGSALPFAMTASCVGRYLDSEHLDGFTLANLTANLSTLSLVTGFFSASDTLSPQAFGAGNFKEVGLLAMRGFFGIMLLIIPINTYLYFQMDNLMVMIGQQPIVAKLAMEWFRIYGFALPFYALFSITWKFLSSQEIMTPLVVTVCISTGIILPVSLQLLVPTFGFEGSAFAMLIYYISQVLLLYLYLWWQRPHEPETWPGFGVWRDALELEPLKLYFRLGAGGMLATSEWWFWEVLSLLIGTMGVIPLSVHTIPTQVLAIGFMVSVGIGVALSIRMGVMLPRDVERTKSLVLWTSVAASCLFFLIQGGIYIFREPIFRIFTNDQDVLDGAERIWKKVVAYCFFLSLFAVNIGIANGLGMQLTLGYITTTFLWVITLPATYVVAVKWSGGIDAAWAMIYPPYIGMNLVLWYKFFTADWHTIGNEIRKREGLDQEESTTATAANITTTTTSSGSDTEIITERTSLV